MLKHSKTDRPANLETIPGFETCLSEEEIIAYLFHPITNEERFRIEAHFSECELCYDAVTGAGKFRTEEELRSYVGSINAAIQKKYGVSAKTQRGSRLMYYSAAAVVLIAFSGFGYWMTRHPERRLADAYIRPYSNTIPLSRSQSSLTLLEEAMSEYEAENYTLAKDKLKLFLQEQPDHTAANLYCGISALISGEAEESLPYFEKAALSEDTRISEAAKWYRALAHLRVGRADIAKKELMEIATGKGYLTESADALVKQMKEE